jgi:hypothetical protein
MDVRHYLVFFGVIVSIAGCATSSSKRCCEHENDSVDIGPLIGLIGMAVDGDDKDDYEDLVHGNSCKCRKCKH